MKNLFLSMLCACGLFAFEGMPLKYKNQTSIDKKFKIEFNNGIIFDACKCGCPKDAADALATWVEGDDIAIEPDETDAKGQVYMLRNLDNDTEVFSWFNEQKEALSEFATIKHIEESRRAFETSDGLKWLAEDQEINWDLGERIFIHSNDLFDPGTVLLLNIDKPESGYVLAKAIEVM